MLRPRKIVTQPRFALALLFAAGRHENPLQDSLALSLSPLSLLPTQQPFLGYSRENTFFFFELVFSLPSSSATSFPGEPGLLRVILVSYPGGTAVENLSSFLPETFSGQVCQGGDLSAIALGEKQVTLHLPSPAGCLLGRGWVGPVVSFPS